MARMVLVDLGFIFCFPTRTAREADTFESSEQGHFNGSTEFRLPTSHKKCDAVHFE